MNDYVLISDSTADLPNEIVEKFNIEIVPFKFTIGDETFAHYPDAREMSIKTFYEKIRKGAMPVTSQVNPVEYKEIFEPFLKDGKDMIYVCFTTGLSGSYQSAVIAGEDLKEKYPDRKIYIIDSLCASVGEGVFVYNIAKMKSEGADIEELKTYIENNRNNARHWFMVEDLFHLKRGGRVSSVEAVIGSALKIKPILSVDEEGKLIVKSKVRGTNRAIEYLVEKTALEGVDLDKQTLFIGHADCIEKAEKAKAMLEEKGIGKDYIIADIGPIIGTHVGPGMVAIACMGKAVD